MSVASPTIHAMLIATWILAIATLVLALSVPVAWFTWLSARRRTGIAANGSATPKPASSCSETSRIST